MEEFPSDIFAIFASELSLKNLLSLATTNSKIKELILNENVNNSLADYYVYPYDLTLTELKKYEDKTHRERLTMAAEIGDQRLVRGLIDKFVFDQFILNFVAKLAAGKGHTEIVNLLVDKGADDIQGILFEAATYGHIDIIINNEKYLEDKDINTYNGIMARAAMSGHMEIVKLMLEKGANALDLSMAQAAKGGQLEIVKFLIGKGAKNYRWALEQASYGNNIEIVKLMLDKGADNYDDAVIGAIENNNKEMLTLLLDSGARHYAIYKSKALRFNRKEMVEIIDSYRSRY